MAESKQSFITNETSNDDVQASLSQHEGKDSVVIGSYVPMYQFTVTVSMQLDPSMAFCVFAKVCAYDVHIYFYTYLVNCYL